MRSFNKAWHIIQEFSLLLVGGSLLAIILANLRPDLYQNMVHFTFWENAPIGHHHNGHNELTLQFIVNDILMTFFFAIAGKEVWEAIALKEGSLRGKKALITIFATAGGVVGPVIVYLFIALFLGTIKELVNGWAIPTATDIAFAYLIGKIIFGKSHPALQFLLALAILDDAIGLIILAIFYPSGDLSPEWLLLSLAIAITVYLVFNFLPRRFDCEQKKYSTIVKNRLGLWPYYIAGCISWFGFYKAGVHPVLSFIPIIMAIPHAEIDFGLFSDKDILSKDLLNRFEHQLENIIPVILMLFGFVNAGISLSLMNDATWSILLGLLLGKPLGITICSIIAMKWFNLPVGMSKKDLPVLGAVAGIGFTVALFVSLQAFPLGEIQEGAKMGALLSFLSCLSAFTLAKMLKVERKIAGNKSSLMYVRELFPSY